MLLTAQWWLMVFSAGDQTGMMLLEEGDAMKKEKSRHWRGRMGKTKEQGKDRDE